MILPLVFWKLAKMIKDSQWQGIIAQEKNQAYFVDLLEEINKQRQQGIKIYPSDEHIFSAFDYVDLPEVKVVILGQDPYHGEGQAQGLAFSVPKQMKIPPSLKNIYKELANDIDGFTIPDHGSLIHWAQQGVLLLNTVLTVQARNAHSHAKLGWETFTDKVIAQINEKNDGCVFMLWGSHAQKKGAKIDTQKHCVLLGPHPSPLSAYRGFFGCKHFSQANAWLTAHEKSAIDWSV